MRFRSEWLRKLGGLMVSSGVQSVMSTLDYQKAVYDSTVDPSHPDFVGPAIFLFWHEYIPVPFYLRPYTRMALLVSRHTDAEWLSQAVRYRGFSVVRGSTARGGTAALRELMRVAEAHNLAITPDGPRGPRRTLAQGPIFLSSALRIPLILIAPGYDRPWRLPTWDRFAIPRFGSRCRVLASPKIQIPADLDRDGIEHYRVAVETLLRRLTDEAEQWAESGLRHPQGSSLIPTFGQPAPLRTRNRALKIAGIDEADAESDESPRRCA